MSYLLVVVIGAVVGLVAGRYIKSDDTGAGVGIGAGAAGACVAVVLSRLAGSPVLAGYFMSTLLAAGGAVGGVFAARYFMKSKAVPVRARARR